jgi:crossover junction endonuclease MUS81
MKIILDERETFLYSECHTLLEKNPPFSIILSKEVLPLGDVLIKTDDDVPLVLIERKTINDLLSSIKDGRYEEQSYRLKNTEEYPLHHILYIIEGMYSFHQDKKTVLSAMTSLFLFKGFSVQRTCSLSETAEYILNMTDKIDRDLKKGKIPAYSRDTDIDIDIVKSYSTVVKKVKKENITSQNIGEIMLSQIPGISATVAISILNYTDHSFLKLIEILKTNPSELEEIMIGDKKPRKISKSIIEKMRELLLV